MPTHERNSESRRNSAVQQNPARNEAIASLKQRLKPGTIVYTVLRSVSDSGISRTLDLYVVAKGEIVRITWSVVQALEWTYDRRKEALRVQGCGMDIGHHTVRSLSRVVFGDESALQHRWL